jgi:hypothetical protein
LLDQHAPSLSGHAEAADDGIDGHEHVVPLNGPILERHIQRKMPPPDADPRGVARNQGAGDAEVGPVSHEPLGIEQAEGQSNHRGDGRQGDVALREIELDADDLRTLPQAPANDARVGYGGGIGTCARPGEGETRHFLATREARQEMILLCLGSVVQQQFRRSQGIRHRNGRGGRARA